MVRVVVGAVGAGGGVAVAWPGTGPISNSHSAPELTSSANSPSCAAIIAAAISPGPPSCSRRHCIPSRSSGRIPTCGAVFSHSWSVRHAIVTESPAINGRGASTLGGAGVAVGSGIGKLDGVAVGAAVGLSVGVSVGTGDSDGVGVKAGARVSGAGVGSEHPARVARNTRMMKVAWRNGFSTWSSLFLWWDQPSILLVARPVPLAPIVRNLGALVPFSMSCLRTSGPCSPGPVEVKIPAGVRRGSWAVCCNAPELFRSVDVAASGAPAPRLCSCSGLLRRRWPLGLPCSPWPWPVWQPIPWPFVRRPVGR